MHVLVEHDAKDTGGYFIYQWPPDTDASGPCTFDDWVETAEDLQRYFVIQCAAALLLAHSEFR
jgi:hypothetical protein